MILTVAPEGVPPLGLIFNCAAVEFISPPFTVKSPVIVTSSGKPICIVSVADEAIDTSPPVPCNVTAVVPAELSVKVIIVVPPEPML